MKRAISVFTAVLLVCLLVTPALAHYNNASYGYVPMSADAITINGVRDDVYEQGLRLEIYRQWADYGDDESATRGTAWLLWREGFLYIFAEITQNALQDQFDAEANQSNMPWEVDSLELFLDPTNDTTGNDAAQFRIDAWGYRSFENRFTGENSYGGDETSADGVFEGAAVISGANYTVEFRIPIEQGAGDAIGFLLQINDMHDFGRSMIFSGSSNGMSRSWEPAEFDYIVLSADEVTAVVAAEPEPEEAPAEEAPVVAEAAPAAEAEAAAPAPPTADPVTLAAFGALAAIAGAVIAKKRK